MYNTNMPTTTTENFDQKKLTRAFGRQWWKKKSSVIMSLRPNYVLTPPPPNTLHTTRDKVYSLSKILNSLSPGRKLLDLPFHLKHLINFRIISLDKISCTLPLLHWPWTLSYFIYICISCVNISLWIRLHTVSHIQA